MLRVTAIEDIGRYEYLVTIDVNGLERTYVFLATPPEFGTSMVSPPEAFSIDLDEYMPEQTGRPIPGPPVFEIPRRLVRKLVFGQEVSLPVILDED